MTPLDMALARLMLAAAGSLVAGAATWGVVLLCLRRWPALAGQRSVWLLAQLAVAAVFVALLLPHAERLRVAPVIEMGDGALSTATRAAPAPLPSAMHDASASNQGFHDFRAAMLLAPAAWCWLALYLAGFGHAVYRQWRATRWLRALTASGRPLSAPSFVDGWSEQTQLPAVIEVDAPISPMLSGWLTPRLLLPRHLRTVDPLQQQLIVAHELTHWRRRDLHWSALALALQALFWFNPFMRRLRLRLGWAQELGCDREVLRGRPAHERKCYAAALVAQLKLQQSPSGVALGFGGNGAPTMAVRLSLIRAPSSSASLGPRCAALLALTLVAVSSLMLQPALGWHTGASNGDAPAGLLAQGWSGAGSTAQAPFDCSMLVDAASGAVLVREGVCDQRVTPASTFKIPISLMGFDSGVLKNEHAPYLPYKQSYKSANPSWRHDADPASWLRESIVWYSQQVTAQLGAARIRRYVSAFDYGNRHLDSVAGMDDAVALSELSPTLRISPLEQTDFLRKVVNRSLPLSAHAYDVTERLLKAAALPNGWQVYGKTGTASVQLADGSRSDEQDIGWYVGWVVKDGRTLVFARLKQYAVSSDSYAGAKTRAAFMDEMAQRTL